MDWVQFTIFFISMSGMWLWQRSEAASDKREAAADRRESAADRRELRAAIDENRRETTIILRAIQEEIKDFHGRLCAIEERRGGR